jgi:hypothetical protein
MTMAQSAVMLWQRSTIVGCCRGRLDIAAE